MEGMDLRELRELVAFLKENGIAEFEFDGGEQHVRLKFESAFATSGALDLSQLRGLAASAASVAATAPVAAPAAVATAHVSAAADEPVEVLHQVKSPIVGTYYESSAPGSPAFVKAGDEVEVGQVICIVEAMKLMNEIESDVAGEVVQVVAKNGQPVEYGQPLFAVRAR